MKTSIQLALAAIAVGFTVTAASAVIGTVSDSDVHRLNSSVSAGPFFLPVPGKMFEVATDLDIATPICRFSNADSGIERDQPRHVVYYNALGRNLPVASLLGLIVDLEDYRLQVELDWNSYVEALAHNFEGQIDDACEMRAQRAYRRGSIVCIVDGVLRDPGTDEIVGVRFKPFAFTPEAVDTYPRCPLRLPEDVFWQIRRAFISTAAAAVPMEADLAQLAN